MLTTMNTIETRSVTTDDGGVPAAPLGAHSLKHGPENAQGHAGDSYSESSARKAASSSRCRSISAFADLFSIALFFSSAIWL
jgi:hypothetical protein